LDNLMFFISISTDIRHPNARWVDEIKFFSGATWMRIAVDRDM